MNFDAVIVVPLFNESNRFDVKPYRDFLTDNQGIAFVLVDDGSNDNTFDLLEGLKAEVPAQVRTLKQPENRGKAEAVRSGVQKALELNSRYIGYWDADLATPLTTIPEFIKTLSDGDRPLVMGSRVKLAGRKIVRNPVRHIMGRVFSTLVSNMLNQGFYDTQCGAKLMTHDVARLCFDAPFISRWCFDVELMFRFLSRYGQEDVNQIESSIVEFPLTVWVDAGDSRIRLYESPMVIVDLIRIWNRYRRV